jgi:hypothetical protein
MLLYEVLKWLNDAAGSKQFIDLLAVLYFQTLSHGHCHFISKIRPLCSEKFFDIFERVEFAEQKIIIQSLHNFHDLDI